MIFCLVLMLFVCCNSLDLPLIGNTTLTTQSIFTILLNLLSSTIYIKVPNNVSISTSLTVCPKCILYFENPASRLTTGQLIFQDDSSLYFEDQINLNVNAIQVQGKFSITNKKNGSIDSSILIDTDKSFQIQSYEVKIINSSIIHQYLLSKLFLLILFTSSYIFFF